MLKMLAVLHCLLLLFLVWRMWNCKNGLVFIGYAIITATQMTELFLITMGRP